MLRTLSLNVLMVLALSACASKPTTEPAQTTNQAATATTYSDERDPFEGFNRSMWTVNYDYLDPYVLRPATVGYMAVTPQPVRSGLANVVDNLDEPASFINGILQAKPKSSAISAGRFLVNSTVGLLGFFDVATAMDLKKQDEDFSQTLAVWGVGNGPYVMVPGMGPTTARDATGRVVDNLYFPMTLLNTPLTIGKFVIGALDGREKLMAQEKLLNDSLDPYAFVKDAYFQRQEYKIYDGNPPEPDIDEEALEEYTE